MVLAVNTANISISILSQLDFVRFTVLYFLNQFLKYIVIVEKQITPHVMESRSGVMAEQSLNWECTCRAFGWRCHLDFAE
jgi:hypothetical protein